MSASKMSLECEYERVPLTINFYASPIIPARTYGPPEDCYPEEGGEVDIEEVLAGGVDILLLIDEKVFEYLEEKCQDYALDQFSSPADNYDDPRDYE